jgi:GH43 family beta-xylosidase
VTIKSSESIDNLVAGFSSGDTYINPVHNRPFPDPFVLKFCGEYFAYCTGIWQDGRCFGILHSLDLVHWEELAGAMDPLPGAYTEYWAPEVSYRQGKFLLYFSVGDGVKMQIRVATATAPAGPFVDCGRKLSSEDFAIDAHMFQDDDGTCYLFYATDFLDRSHIGTGTVVDRLIDPFTLAGTPHPVSLPRFDWQVFDPQRHEKGGVRWHTIEGPFVLTHKGKYYQMFSAGNWKNLTYGVSFALSDSIATDQEWTQIEHDDRAPLILRTIPGSVVGPGHNSAIRGPDNRQMFCIYHRWADDASGRVLAIDRLDWSGERLTVLGPTTTAQPTPIRPVIECLSEERALNLNEPWSCNGGNWLVHGTTVTQELCAVAEARCRAVMSCFLVEVTLRGIQASGPELTGPSKRGAFGIRLFHEQLTFLAFSIIPGIPEAVINLTLSNGEYERQHLPLSPSSEPTTFHLLRIEINHQLVKITLDDTAARWEGQVTMAPDGIALFTDNTAAAFAGFSLTPGWEDLFMESCEPEKIGWEAATGQQHKWVIENKQLCQSDPNARHAVIAKNGEAGAYELVVNAVLQRIGDEPGCYGFQPALTAGGEGPLITVELKCEGPFLCIQDVVDGHRYLPLPSHFNPFIYQQLRFAKEGTRLSIQWEETPLASIEVPAQANRIGLYCDRAIVAFDMVRFTLRH